MNNTEIITKKQVSFTFDSKPCLLRRSITKVVNQKGLTSITIVTDRCNIEKYEEKIPIKVPIRDEAGDETGRFIDSFEQDEDGNDIIVEKQNFVSYDQIDKDHIKNIGNNTLDIMFDKIRSNIDFSSHYSDVQTKINTELLLSITKEETPYGTASEDWEVYNE